MSEHSETVASDRRPKRKPVRRSHRFLLALRDRRLALGLSQAELAEAVGVHRVQICHWEQGRDAPFFFNFEAWVNALGLDLKLDSAS